MTWNSMFIILQKLNNFRCLFSWWHFNTRDEKSLLVFRKCEMTITDLRKFFPCIGSVSSDFFLWLHWRYVQNDERHQKTARGENRTRSSCLHRFRSFAWKKINFNYADMKIEFLYFLVQTSKLLFNNRFLL